MIDANLFQIDKSQVSGYLADTISCRILLALPLAGTSPGIATSSLRCLLSSPVACLSLCSPVFCHLESSGRSCNSSWGSNGCGCSRLAVSRPISYAFVSTPFFLRSCGKVSSFGHKLRLSSSLSSLSILLLNLLRISVEEQVRHNFPRHVSADGSPQSEEIETLKAEIEELQLNQKQASIARTKMNKEFIATVSDQQATQQLLTKSLKVLATFYNKAALVQESAQEATSSKQPPPPGFKKLNKSAASGG